MAKQNWYFNYENKALNTDNQCSPNAAGRLGKNTTELLKTKQLLFIERNKLLSAICFCIHLILLYDKTSSFTEMYIGIY